MKKVFIVVGIIVLVLLFMINCLSKKSTYSSFLSDNGKLYVYFEHDYHNYMLKDIVVGEASREQIINCLSNNSVDVKPLGKITTAEDAVKKGTNILNLFYANWTCDNSVGVFKHKEADVWVVHGQVERRGSKDKLGIVVFDASTGRVLGIDLIEAN